MDPETVAEEKLGQGQTRLVKAGGRFAGRREAMYKVGQEEGSGDGRSGGTAQAFEELTRRVLDDLGGGLRRVGTRRRGSDGRRGRLGSAAPVDETEKRTQRSSAGLASAVGWKGAATQQDARQEQLLARPGASGAASEASFTAGAGGDGTAASESNSGQTRKAGGRTQLLLVRHGQSVWNAQGRWQGQVPPVPKPLRRARCVRGPHAFCSFCAWQTCARWRH